MRSAGSQGPFDLVLIDLKRKYIQLVQCKAGAYKDKVEAKLYEEYSPLVDGEYRVEYVVK